MGAAYDVTEEEVPWFEEESVHAEMLKRQIIGETRCKYEFCPDSSKHRTAVCPKLHSRCKECHCRGHYANTIIRRDGENKAVCPKSKEINKLPVREIQMGFEMSATRGLLTKYRHSLPACGIHPCNTNQHVGILQLITYAKLNCMKTEKAVAMLEDMYRALCDEAMISDVVVSDEEKFKKRDVRADRLVLIMIKTSRDGEDSIVEACATLSRLPNNSKDQRIEDNKFALEKQRHIIIRSKEKMEAAMTAYKQIHKAKYYAGKHGNTNVEGGHLLPERFSSPLAALPKLLQFEERMRHWSDTLTRINSETNSYLSSRAHAQHLARRLGEPIVGDKRNLAEVVSGEMTSEERLFSRLVLQP
jgi:hypothetical protein